MNQEQTASSILAAVPDAILLTDEDGRFEYVCPNVENIFQRTADEVRELKTLEVVMGPIPFDMQELDRGGCVDNVSWVITRPSGERRHLNVHVRRVEIGKGTLLLTCRDTTDLEKSRDQYYRFFEESLNLKIIIGFDATIYQVNRRCIEVLGKTEAEIKRTPALKFVHPDDREATSQEIKKLAAGAQTLSFEHRILDSEGNVLWILWTARPDIEQGICFASGQDITDRKNAEQRLVLQHATTSMLHEAKSWEAISEELLRRVMEQFSGAIAECWLVHDDELVLSMSVSNGSHFDQDYQLEETIQQSFRYGNGVPGVVWKSGDVVQIADLLKSRTFDRQYWAKRNCLKCVVGFPLTVHERVVGTLLIYNERIQQIDAEMRTTLLGIGQQLGQYLARQEAEKKRREIDDLLQAIVSETTDAIFVKDTNGCYLLCNGATARILGKPLDDIIGRSDLELLGAENVSEILEHDHLIMESGRANTTEETFFSSGALRTFLATKAPYRNVEGDIAGVIGISRDITERKQIHNELKEQGSQLSEALEIARLGYWERTIDSNTVQWSDELYTIFGVSRNSFEHTYQAFLECILLADRESVNNRILQAVKDGGEFEHEYQIAVDDHVKIIHERGRVLLDSTGNPSWIKGTAQDITEHRNLKESLTKREEELRLLENAVRVASEGLIITDAQNSDDHIIYVSPGFERITGYSSEEVIGRNCRFLQGPDTDRDSVFRIRDAIRMGVPVTVEILNYRKDGTSFWNKISIAPLRNANNEVTHFVGVQSDITDRRRLEERFQQTQKMEAIGQLAGGIAHDFNNLLTVIVGYCEVIVSDTPRDHPLRKYSEEVLEAGIRASELTEQLLAFSRKHVFQSRIVDVNEVVNETAGLLRRLIGEQIQLNLDLNSISLNVRIDPTQFNQILMNLAVNARDAMPNGGLLTIETASLFLEDESIQGYGIPQGRYVLISVTDSGEGIPKEIRDRVFEPFFTTKPRGRGTGMGLSTVFGIIKQSGGHINLYSELNQGTCFKIYLPEVEDSVSPVKSIEENASFEGSETILVVEDDKSVREAARRFLERFGYQVHVAEDPATAIKLSLEIGDQIDLLLTDVVMPQMNGRQLAQTFLKLRPLVRVLYMSGYTDGAIVTHGMIDSETNFIQKPFTAISLARSVRRILDVDNQPSGKSNDEES